MEIWRKKSASEYKQATGSFVGHRVSGKNGGARGQRGHMGDTGGEEDIETSQTPWGEILV